MKITHVLLPSLFMTGILVPLTFLSALFLLADGCYPDVSLPLRMIETDDGLPSVLVFTGHAHQQQLLPLTWPTSGEQPVVLLPPGHALASDLNDVGPADASDPVTMSRLLVAWRSVTALWRAGTVPSVRVPRFNLGRNSSWWLKYPHIVATSIELHGYPCTPTAPVGDTTTVRINETRLTARVGHGRAWTDLVLEVDLSRAQTYLPVALLAAVVSKPDALTLTTQPAGSLLATLSAAELRDDALVTFDPLHVNGTRVVLGRRLARRLLASWTANASGVIAAGFVTRHPSSDGVSYTLLGVGAVAAYLLAFWTTTIASDDTPRKRQRHLRVLRHALILALVATIGHALALPFVLVGPQLSPKVARSLEYFGVAYYLPASVGHFFVLVTAAVRLFLSGTSAAAAADTWSALASAHWLLVTRTLMVALLPAAARSFFSVLVFLAGILVLVLLPTVYASIASWVRVFAQWRQLRPWALLAAVTTTTSLVLTSVGTYLCILVPVFEGANARFAGDVIVAASVILATAPWLGGAFLSAVEEKQ